VQFWLLGLDARRGDLTRLGYRKTPMLLGSSAYTLDFMERHRLILHSTGLTLHLPEGELQYERRNGQFSFTGQPLLPVEGRRLIRPFVHHHEARILGMHGPEWRTAQLKGHALPAPIRRTLPDWHRYMEGLEAQTWQAPLGRPSHTLPGLM